MKTIIGHLKNIIGKIFAKDEEGNLREVHSGDPIYSGEIIVDVRGEKIPDAIRAVKEDIADQSSEEVNVEADLKDDDFDKKDSKSKDYRSTTSTDNIDSAGEEVNVDAQLRDTNFSESSSHIFSSGAGASNGDEVNVVIPPIDVLPPMDTPLPPLAPTTPTTPPFAGGFPRIDSNPTITLTQTSSADILEVDETNLNTSVTASFSDNFTSIQDYGINGAGSVTSTYELSLIPGVTGLVDMVTRQDVVLVMNSTVVEGQNSDGNVVFTLTTDNTGLVTFTQERAVIHPNVNDPDDSISLINNLIILTREDTITDIDGDKSTASDSIELGTNLNFI